jgi:tetratricopeptide (TPR) repeat protein
MSFKDDILIDNYLRGLLNQDEIERFKLRLKSDLEFKKTFLLEQALWTSQNDSDWSFANQKSEEVKTYKKLLEDNDLQNLKKTLSRVNEEFKASPKKKTRFNFYYLVAASIALLICLSLFLNQDPSNQQLVKDYIDTSNLPSFVSRGDESADDLIEAQQYFENKNYQKSLDIFIPAIETDNTNGSIYLYAGIAQMELEQYNTAEVTFEALISSNLLDAPKGYWYKALLYLKQDRIDETKIVLEKIISEKLYSHVKAKELFDEIN